MWCQWLRMHRACDVNDTVCMRACSVNDTPCIVHAVSMHRMHYASSFIDTACIYNFFAYHRCFAYDFHFSLLFLIDFELFIDRACGVNDTEYTVHAVSMTLHASSMWCHWHRMPFLIVCIPWLFCICFSLFVVVQQSFCACGVNDTAMVCSSVHFGVLCILKYRNSENNATDPKFNKIPLTL
jgi:hypothetical protein